MREMRWRSRNYIHCSSPTAISRSALAFKLGSLGTRTMTKPSRQSYRWLGCCNLCGSVSLCNLGSAPVWLTLGVCSDLRPLVRLADHLKLDRGEVAEACWRRRRCIWSRSRVHDGQSEFMAAVPVGGYPERSSATGRELRSPRCPRLHTPTRPIELVSRCSSGGQPFERNWLPLIRMDNRALRIAQHDALRNADTASEDFIRESME